MKLANKIAAVGNFDVWLCDLDGTLAETMPIHHCAYAEVFAEFGGSLSWDDFITLSGPPARITIPLFAQAAGVAHQSLPNIPDLHARKKAVLDRLVAKGGVEALEAANLVKHAPPRVRIAVVTSGNSHGAAAIIDAIGLTDRIELVVSGDDLERGKPDPQPYLLAAKLMGVEPDQCLVLEDHPDGIASGRAAGMTVIDVAAHDLAEGSDADADGAAQ